MRARRSAYSSRSKGSMAGPPGSAKPRQRALEALAEGRGGDRRAWMIGHGDRDGLDVARAQRIERRERGAHQVTMLDERRAVERCTVERAAAERSAPGRRAVERPAPGAVARAGPPALARGPRVEL